MAVAIGHGPMNDPRHHARHRLPTGAISREPVHTAISHAHVHQATDRAGGRRKAIDWLARQFRPLRPGARRGIEDVHPAAHLLLFGEAADHIQLPIVYRRDQRPALERLRQRAPARRRIAQVETEHGIAPVLPLVAEHVPAAHHVERVAHHSQVVARSRLGERR